jgi:hypothetical protein
LLLPLPFFLSFPQGICCCPCPRRCLFFAVILELQAKDPRILLASATSRTQNETSMCRLLIALCLTTLATPILIAQSATDLNCLHHLTAPISKLNPPDRHEILHHLQIVASQLRAEAVTISGQQSFFVQAQPGIGSQYCGNINCQLWIFDADHKILLEANAESVGYLPTVHNGRNDVLIARHNSAVEQGVAQWQFDGRCYRRARCVDAKYGDFEGKVYKTPHIEPTPCQYM